MGIFISHIVFKKVVVWLNHYFFCVNSSIDICTDFGGAVRCRLFRLSAFPTDKPACRCYRPRYILRVNICHIPLTAYRTLMIVCLLPVTHIAGTFFLNNGNTFLALTVAPFSRFTNAKTSSVSRKNFCRGLS